jgi:hypothetical protein
MNVKRHSQKCIAGAILIALIFSYFPITGISVKTARAQQVQVVDYGDSLSVPIQNYTEAAQKFVHTGVSIFGVPLQFTSWDSIIKFAVKQIIQDLQKQVVSWINKGDNGNPIFETNLNLYLNEVHDQVGQQYLDTLSGDSGQLCGYFKNGVVYGLSEYFNIPVKNAVSQKGNCTAENVAGKNTVSNFVGGDFQNSGGWNTWALITQNDDSNPLGAFLTEQSRTENAIANQKQIEEEKLDWGQGYHSIEDNKGNVTTPGTNIKNQADSVLTSDLRQLEQAKTFDDAITVLAQSLIDGIITGNGGLRGSSGGSNNSSGKYLKQKYPTTSTSKGAGTSGTPVGGGTNGGTGGAGGTTGGGSASSATLHNVSISGTATQSSTPGNHPASVALTGYRNRDPGIGGLSITSQQDNPWWQVDLGSEQPIDHIEITPRINDGFGDDLNYFYVFVSENPITGSAIPTAGPGIWSSGLITVANPRTDTTTITPPAGTIGRYVRIQENHNARLEIAGVQVFAKAVPILTLTGNDPLVVPLGYDFKADPAAVAIDQVDGDISDKIVVTGVNTSVRGTYTATYTVTNSAGVTSAPVSRTVKVQ